MATPGEVGWFDLTVNNAEEVCEFYRAIVGWDSTSLSMGDYDDFCMALPGTDKTVAGICHARGSNANLPAQWLIYITVEDVDASAEKCVALGGKVIEGPRKVGDGRFCVIQDPAGAVAALYAAVAES